MDTDPCGALGAAQPLSDGRVVQVFEDPQLDGVPLTVTDVVERVGQGGRQQQARVGDGVGVIEADVELVEGVGDAIEKVPSWSGIRQLSRVSFSQVRGPFSWLASSISLLRR